MTKIKNNIFKHRCATLINTNESRRMLHSFGYTPIDFIEYKITDEKDKDSYCKWLVTNSIYMTETDNVECYDIVYNCGMNKKLFYAITAINDNNDYKQWFTDGTEFIMSKSKTFYKDGFRKATPEELIEYFGGLKSTVCWCGSAMCQVSKYDEYLKIKNGLSKIGHNVDNMMSDEDWIDEYLGTNKECFINLFVDYGGSVKIEIVDSTEKCNSRYWCYDDLNMFLALASSRNKEI